MTNLKNPDKKQLRNFGFLIGLGLPIEIAPLRSSTSDIINLASIAAYSADVIDYNK